MTENLKVKFEIKPNYNEETLRVDYDKINKNTNLERFRDRQLKNFERMKKEYQNERMVTDIEERFDTRKSSMENKSKPILLNSDKSPLKIRQRKGMVDKLESADRMKKQL